MSSPSATPNTYPYQNEPTWSKSEKAIARTAFDAAMKRELQDIMRKTKQMATQIKEPADVWELEHYLTERRKEIDRKYDYRYSQGWRLLTPVVTTCTSSETKALSRHKSLPSGLFRQVSRVGLTRQIRGTVLSSEDGLIRRRREEALDAHRNPCVQGFLP